MNRISLALAALLAATSLAGAQAHFDKKNGANGTIINGVAPIYLYNSAGPTQSISASTLASATSLTVPSNATIAEICIETAGVRYLDDGNTPTASVGLPAVATSLAPYCFQYAGPLGSIKFIAISGSPTMTVSYYYAN